jgi:hypothetical protein
MRPDFLAKGRRRRVPLALFVLGGGLIMWFGLLSHIRLFGPVLGLRSDLVEHVCAFAYMGFFGLLLWRPLFNVVIGLIMAAGVLEILQMVFPFHHASVIDWSASSLGVVCGALVWRALRFPPLSPLRRIVGSE